MFPPKNLRFPSTWSQRGVTVNRDGSVVPAVTPTPEEARKSDKWAVEEVGDGFVVFESDYGFLKSDDDFIAEISSMPVPSYAFFAAEGQVVDVVMATDILEKYALVFTR